MSRCSIATTKPTTHDSPTTLWTASSTTPMNFRSLVLLTGLLAAHPVLAAQKNIRLSDTLSARADRLDVRKGTQWAGHILCGHSN